MINTMIEAYHEAHRQLAMLLSTPVGFAINRTRLRSRFKVCQALHVLCLCIVGSSWCSLGCAEQHATDKTTSRRIQLVVDDQLSDALAGKLSKCYVIVRMSDLSAEKLVSAVADGDSLVWIGPPVEVPAVFWVGNFRPSTVPLRIRVADSSPLPLDDTEELHSLAWSAFIRPPSEFPKHNIDEEIRADFAPIFEAFDRFGQLVGYPGVVFSHTAPSLVGRRFDGSECYFFFFDNPATAVSLKQWEKLLEQIAVRHQSGLQVKSLAANFASYSSGERSQIRVRVRNQRSKAAAIELRFLVKAPGQAGYSFVTSMRRVAEAFDDTEAVCDYLVPSQTGLYRFKVEVRQDPQAAENLAEIGSPIAIERRETGFVVVDRPLKTPAPLEISGTNFKFAGEEGFWIGTHYYPSSSWWEWAWRDFEPITAERDFRAMRGSSYRIVRVWVDPVLDESVLRAMDAAAFLAAEQGIVLDVCLFNQWVRELGFERASGEHCSFEFRNPLDFNVYSISLRNIKRQCEYVQTLAHRWREVGNIVYNLANETYIKDPDPTQLDPDTDCFRTPLMEYGEQRDSLLFRAWAAEITAAIRTAGGQQPVFGGYLFSLSGGGDAYLANTDSEIMPWHGYFEPKQIASTLQYFDSICSGRPLLMEEIGSLGWNNEAHYDAAVHYAFASGAAAVMSYEWGVSRIAKEACFVPLPIRDAVRAKSDPRWFAPIIEYATANTSERGVGIAPWPSGFGYGSIYHGTPFPAAAAVALSRIGIMAKELARALDAEQVYVLIPEAQTSNIETYLRLFERLWQEGVEFGVWQEADIKDLPDVVRTIICPGNISENTQQTLNQLQSSGVEVYSQPNDDWLHARVLPKVDVTPSGLAKVLMRRTTKGTLYSVFLDQPSREIRIDMPRHTVTLGVDSYGLVLQGPMGVGMVEASGSVMIDEQPYCHIDRGRAILVAEDWRNLLDSQRIYMMVTEPSQIRFQQPIQSVEVYAENADVPIGQVEVAGNATTLDVDRELARYRLKIEFGP